MTLLLVGCLLCVCALCFGCVHPSYAEDECILFMLVSPDETFWVNRTDIYLEKKLARSTISVVWPICWALCWQEWWSNLEATSEKLQNPWVPRATSYINPDYCFGSRGPDICASFHVVMVPFLTSWTACGSRERDLGCFQTMKLVALTFDNRRILTYKHTLF